MPTGRAELKKREGAQLVNMRGESTNGRARGSTNKPNKIAA